ncbi:hypothetical protein ACF0H5_009451 [Mactra antiquata]
MNAIVYTNILLTVIISACAAAGLTDEQLAQIFSEKSDRNELLPDSQDDFVSIRDEVNNLDQTLSLLGDTDDAVRLAAEDGKTFSDINHEEKYVSSEMLAKTDEEGQHKRINDIYPHRKNANDGLTLPGHNLLPGSRSNNLQGSRPRDGLRRGTIPLCGTSKNDCLRKIYGQFRQ